MLQAEEERNSRYGHSSAIYVVDLDGLKEVNDTCGHLAGDELIRQTAQLLRHSVRTEDVVARLGGDEFAILTIETSETEANVLKKRIQPALINNQVEASVGVAICWCCHPPACNWLERSFPSGLPADVSP